MDYNLSFHLYVLTTVCVTILSLNGAINIIKYLCTWILTLLLSLVCYSKHHHLSKIQLKFGDFQLSVASQGHLLVAYQIKRSLKPHRNWCESLTPVQFLKQGKLPASDYSMYWVSITANHGWNDSVLKSAFISCGLNDFQTKLTRTADPTSVNLA